MSWQNIKNHVRKVFRPQGLQAPSGVSLQEEESQIRAEQEEIDFLKQEEALLTEQSKVVMRLGHMLLACGASSYRVKLSMARLAAALGVREHHAQVTFGEISSTVYGRFNFRTEVAEQRAFGTNAAQLDRLRVFVQRLKLHMSVEEANQALDKISANGPEYGTVANMLASGISCACFCFLNRGGLMECILAGIAATAGQALRKQMMIRHMNHFGVWMACGVVASTVYVALASLFNFLLPHLATASQIASLPVWFTGTASGYHAGIVSAVLFLVPGFPLITAMLDLVRTDLAAGINRSVYVLMLVVSAGAAVWLTALAFNWAVDPPATPPVSGVWLYLIRMVCSFVAAYGFAMLFNCTLEVSFWAALICAIVNPLRFFGVDEGLLWQFAVGVAAFAIGMGAHLVSRMTKYAYSRVSLSVPAAVLMIPGVPLYAGLTHMNQGNYTEAISSVTEVCIVILAVGIGLALARMVTDPNWRKDAELRRLQPGAENASTYVMR